MSFLQHPTGIYLTHAVMIHAVFLSRTSHLYCIHLVYCIHVSLGSQVATSHNPAPYAYHMFHVQIAWPQAPGFHLCLPGYMHTAFPSVPAYLQCMLHMLCRQHLYHACHTLHMCHMAVHTLSCLYKHCTTSVCEIPNNWTLLYLFFAVPYYPPWLLSLFAFRFALHILLSLCSSPFCLSVSLCNLYVQNFLFPDIHQTASPAYNSMRHLICFFLPYSGIYVFQRIWHMDILMYIPQHMLSTAETVGTAGTDVQQEQRHIQQYIQQAKKHSTQQYSMTCSSNTAEYKAGTEVWNTVF